MHTQFQAEGVSRVPRGLLELMRPKFFVRHDSSDFSANSQSSLASDAGVGDQRDGDEVREALRHRTVPVPEDLCLVLRLMFHGVLGHDRSYEEIQDHKDVRALIFWVDFVLQKQSGASSTSPTIEQSEKFPWFIVRALAPVLCSASTLDLVEIQDATSSLFERLPHRFGQLIQHEAARDFLERDEGKKCVSSMQAAVWGYCGLIYLYECRRQGNDANFTTVDFRAPLELFHDSAKEAHGLALMELRRLEEFDALKNPSSNPKPRRLMELFRKVPVPVPVPAPSAD